MDGATVVITGRGKQALSDARDEILAAAPGARVEMFVSDSTKEDELKAALAFAHGLEGHLDMLIPTVGGAFMQPLLMSSAENVRQEFEVNFVSNYLMIRHGAPLLTRGGSITCISTSATMQPFWGMAVYSASKSALERFVRSAAFELGKAGIRVNSVRPGFTVDEEAAASGQHDAIASETVLGRVGVPDDIARVVRFMAGPEAGWVTGQNISADGGMDQGKAPDMMDMIFGSEKMDQIRAGQELADGDGPPKIASVALRPVSA